MKKTVQLGDIILVKYRGEWRKAMVTRFRGWTDNYRGEAYHYESADVEFIEGDCLGRSHRINGVDRLYGIEWKELEEEK